MRHRGIRGAEVELSLTMLNPFVALAGNSAKQLSTHCARPFAALRVTQARHSWNRRLPRLNATGLRFAQGDTVWQRRLSC